jgi:predicted naringenin-chalcone synthase
MTALYVAKQLIEADESGRAVVLVACAEACSLHVCKVAKLELAIGNSIFGDGAGAAIVTHAGFRGAAPSSSTPPQPAYELESDAHEWRLGTMSSEVVPDSAGHMTWKQSSESGRYDMWLAKEIPTALMGFFASNAAELLYRVGLNPLSCAWALHPGGKGIINSFEKALNAMPGVSATGLEASHSVLDNYGNMSSATIFFVLQRVLSSTARNSVFFAAFGPGLTVEFGALLRLPRARS